MAGCFILSDYLIKCPNFDVKLNEKLIFMIDVTPFKKVSYFMNSIKMKRIWESIPHLL